MKRIISLILSLFMIASTILFVACGSSESTVTTTAGNVSTTNKEAESTTKKDDTQTSTASNIESTTSSSDIVTTTISIPEETTAEGLDGKAKHPDYMDVNFGGKVFNFLAKTETDDWDAYDIYKEATGDDNLLIEGIIERNAIVESLYNCKIKLTNTDDQTSLIANDLALGVCNYEFLNREYSNSIMSNNCLNFANLDIDLTHEWFDQDFIRTFGVNVDGQFKLNVISGAFNLHSYDAIWAMFYNKNIYETLIATGKTSIDLYQTIRDGKWTVDTMLELMTAAATDVDGDQQMTYANGDIFGMIGVANACPDRGIFYGIGGRASIYDESEQNVVAISTSNFDISRLNSAIDKAQSLFSSNVYYAASISDTQASLTNGQALFVSECLQLAQRITDEDAYFSIVPQPKYDENQESYCTYYCTKAYGMMASKACSDLKQIADFLEVWGYHSLTILYPQYINYYQTQCFCDEEAAEMLDLTIKSATYDLDQFAGGGLTDACIGYLTGKNMLSKAIASKSNNANNTFKNRIENFKNLY